LSISPLIPVARWFLDPPINARSRTSTDPSTRPRTSRPCRCTRSCLRLSILDHSPLPSMRTATTPTPPLLLRSTNSILMLIPICLTNSSLDTLPSLCQTPSPALLLDNTLLLLITPRTAALILSLTHLPPTPSSPLLRNSPLLLLRLSRTIPKRFTFDRERSSRR
jgi:hypothetical protein